MKDERKRKKKMEKEDEKDGRKRIFFSHVQENVLKEDHVVVINRERKRKMKMRIILRRRDVLSDIVKDTTLAGTDILYNRTTRLAGPISPLLSLLSGVEESVCIFASLSLDEIHSLLKLSLEGDVAVVLFVLGMFAVDPVDVKAIVGSFSFAERISVVCLH